MFGLPAMMPSLQRIISTIRLMFGLERFNTFGRVTGDTAGGEQGCKLSGLLNRG